jgi:hypothetical protein
MEVLRTNFDGMTDIKFTYQDHEKTLQKLIKALHKSFTKADKDFILNFFSLNPKWELVDIPNIQRLPAVQWKIKNLEKMPKDKLEEQLKKQLMLLVNCTYCCKVRKYFTVFS